MHFPLLKGYLSFPFFYQRPLYQSAFSSWLCLLSFFSRAYRPSLRPCVQKSLQEAQGLHIPTDNEMTRGIKREGQFRQLEERKERNIPPKKNSNHIFNKARLCQTTSPEKSCLFPSQRFFCTTVKPIATLQGVLLFLKTTLILRSVLKLGQPNFDALQWGVMLFSFVRKKMNE